MMLLRSNSAFRNLFIGRILSVFADAVLFFSLLKWIELRSGSSESFTWFYAAYYLPITLLALPIGAWIGSRTLQKVMSVSNGMRVIILTIFLCVAPFISYEWAYLLLIIESILALFFIPANQSLLPHLVNEEERPSANSLLQIGFTVVKIMGQVFTAFMIKLSWSPHSLLIGSAGLLLASLLFIHKIKPLVKNTPSRKQSQWQLMKEGVRYIITDRQLMPLFSFLAIAMFVAGSIDLVLISFLTEKLLVGVENLSFIGTASLLGMIIGASLVPRLYHKLDRKWLLIPPLFALFISIAALLVINHWLLILPFFFAQGIALGCFNITLVTYLQDYVVKENYTRTFSLYHMITSTMTLPGILLIGGLLSNLGVHTTILIVSMLLLLLGIAGIIFIPKLGNGASASQSSAKAAA